MYAQKVVGREAQTQQEQPGLTSAANTPEWFVDNRAENSKINSLQMVANSSSRVQQMGNLQATIQRTNQISTVGTDQPLQMVRDPRLQDIIDALQVQYNHLEASVAMIRDPEALDLEIFVYVEGLVEAEQSLNVLMQQGDFDRTDEENGPLVTSRLMRQIVRRQRAFESGTLISDIRGVLEQKARLAALEAQLQQLQVHDEVETDDSSDEEETVGERLEHAMEIERARLLGTGIHKNLLYRDFFVKPMAEDEVEAEFRGNQIMSLFIDNSDTLKLPGFGKHTLSKTIRTKTGKKNPPTIAQDQEVLVTEPATGDNFNAKQKYTAAEISSIAEVAVYDYVANIGDRMVSQVNPGNVMVDSQRGQVTAVDNSVSRSDILRSGTNLNKAVRSVIRRFVGKGNYSPPHVESGIARALARLEQVLGMIREGDVEDISVIIDKGSYQARKFAGVMGKSEHLISRRIIIVLKNLKARG